MMYMSLPTIVILALASIFLLVAFVSYFMRRRGRRDVHLLRDFRDVLLSLLYDGDALMPMVPHSEREMYRAWAKENSRAQMDERGWVYESDYADFMRRPGVEEIRGIIRGWSVLQHADALEQTLESPRIRGYASTRVPERGRRNPRTTQDRSIRKETS
jgi:hypothetical protein